MHTRMCKLNGPLTVMMPLRETLGPSWNTLSVVFPLLGVPSSILSWLPALFIALKSHFLRQNIRGAKGNLRAKILAA